VLWLAAIVAASFLVRTALGWLRATPVFFPDEYIYSELGRSLIESGRPLIRGGSADFPALLQPLVTAPAWLVNDVAVAYRLVQAIGALAMSLAAVPVFLLARRLGLDSRVALAVAALSALVPDLIYTSYISSEVLAYPLALGVVYVAVRALAQPTRKAQLAFVGLAVLAGLARAQLAVLPLVFAIAVPVLGAREGRLLRSLREQLLPLAVFAALLIAAVGSGPTRSVGIYRWLLGFHASATGIAHWAALDAMMLVYAAGWVIVPGALVGIWLAVRSPRSREELAFGVVAILLSAILLVEGGFLQASLPAPGREIQERYVFYVVPLLGLSFALYASRGWPFRIAHLLVAAGLLLMSVRIPLSSYTTPRTIDGSPTLYAVVWLGRKLGAMGDAASAVAMAVGLMTCVVVLASRRPRVGTPVALALALLATGVASAGAVAMVVGSTHDERKLLLPRDASWVDHARVGRTVLLQSTGGARMPSLQELFWNRSIDRVMLLPGALPIDGYRSQRVRVAGNGTLLVQGKPLSSALLVDEYGSTIRLRNTRMVKAAPSATLWAPGTRPQLSLYAAGRYFDGWLAGSGVIRLWPTTEGGRIAGWLTMRLSAPTGSKAVTMTFEAPRAAPLSIPLRARQARQVRIPVCAQGVSEVAFRADVYRLVGLRIVSAKASKPDFTPDASACSAGRRSS